MELIPRDEKRESEGILGQDGKPRRYGWPVLPLATRFFTPARGYTATIRMR